MDKGRDNTRGDSTPQTWLMSYWVFLPALNSYCPFSLINSSSIENLEGAVSLVPQSFWPAGPQGR